VGSVFRYLAIGDEAAAVPDWFSALEPAPVFQRDARRLAVWFKHFGPLAIHDGQLDAKNSPLVTIFEPRQQRTVLWTAGEVHFLATPLKTRFPKLHNVSRAFSRWLASQECVFSRRSAMHDWDYYLEGALRNFDPEIFAFPEAMRALRSGQYFVAYDTSSRELEVLCKALRLRGVNVHE